MIRLQEHAFDVPIDTAFLYQVRQFEPGTLRAAKFYPVAIERQMTIVHQGWKRMLYFPDKVKGAL